METIQVGNWDEFGSALAKLQSRIRQQESQGGSHVSELLFRGQGNASWGLSTTLERYTADPVLLREYFRKIAIVQHHFEAFSGERWDFDFSAAERWAGFLPAGPPPGYEYMSYLRHHGFPSPLLDWTASPQIAAFFAFRDRPPERGDAVAIYAYCEMMGGGKMTSSSCPCISTYGPTIRGHPRHFLQRSRYSICTVFKEDGQYFAPHDEATATPPPGMFAGQDQIWKFVIPVSERSHVLRSLNEYNLNAFSLFNTTEALSEALAFEHFGAR